MALRCFDIRERLHPHDAGRTVQVVGYKWHTSPNTSLPLEYYDTIPLVSPFQPAHRAPSEQQNRFVVPSQIEHGRFTRVCEVQFGDRQSTALLFSV